jgi:hypothetical protein
VINNRTKCSCFAPDSTRVERISEKKGEKRTRRRQNFIERDREREKKVEKRNIFLRGCVCLIRKLALDLPKKTCAMITSATLGEIFGIAVVIYWPPYLFTYIRSEDKLWYGKVSKMVMFAPRLWVAGFLHFIGLTLLFVAATLHLINVDGDKFPSDLDVASLSLFFVNVMAVHFLYKTLFHYQRAAGMIVVAIVAVLSAMALTVMCALLGYWPSFGLMVAYVIYMLFGAAMAINWFLCGPIPNECNLHQSPMVCDAKIQALIPQQQQQQQVPVYYAQMQRI